MSKNKNGGNKPPRDDDDYVGYGHPPKKNQFKPGQSGNKAGRPKGVRNVETDLDDLLNGRMVIRDAGGERSVSRQFGLMLGLFAKGVKGDSRAGLELLKMKLQFDQKKADRNLGDAFDEDMDILDAFLEAEIERRLAERLRKGAEKVPEPKKPKTPEGK